MKNRLIKSGAIILAAGMSFITTSMAGIDNNVVVSATSTNTPISFIAGNTLTSVKDSVMADFDELVRVIEDTHPDPYMSFGGRVFFHKRANDIRRELMNDSNVNVTALYRKASEFISQMQDGHSFLNSPQNVNNASGSDSLLVVKFMCDDGALIVNAIDSARGDLIGSRLIGINGVPIEEVLDRVAVSHPCENRYGRLSVLCNWFRPVSFYRTILANSFSDSYSGLNTSIRSVTDTARQSDFIMDFLTSDGDTIRYVPEKVQYNQFGEIAKARAPRDERFPSEQMEWKEVDGTMFFRLASVIARENFEFQYNNRWDFYDQLAYQYRTMGKDMPSDTLAAIKALPSMSETFLEMLQEMKAKDLKNLVIDLRGNGGGWTPIVLPTLYMMFGDRYLDTDMDAKFYRRISDLYLNKVTTDIATFNANNGTQLKVGDYLMPEEKATDTRTME
ncbi:MAG: S41 family peptidase, partial [Muribaculaceae bacterium]|nr:S41 family peptidase [Muribaculaceae bacterium]